MDNSKLPFGSNLKFFSTKRLVLYFKTLPYFNDEQFYQYSKELIKAPDLRAELGRNARKRSLQYAIQALPLLDAGVRLEIVGNGLYKENLLKLLKGLGLEDRIDFYQGLPREELLHRYAAADLLVLLSRYESFSIVVAEALVSKTPCITANTSALKEWVDGENCFGVDYPVIIDRLAGLINEIIGRQVGEVKLWDWDEVVEETVMIYKG